MSINPARTVASALPSGVWTASWIYFLAPMGGMLLAVEIYRRLRELRPVRLREMESRDAQALHFLRASR